VPAADARIEILQIRETDLLEDSRPSGAWRRTRTSFLLEGGEGALVLPTIRLGVGGKDYVLTLQHRYDFLRDGFGRLEASTDDGGSWRPVSPVEGYDAEEGWIGSQPVWRTSTFDLAAFASKSLLMRLVGAAPERVIASDEWEIAVATVRETTANSELNLSGGPALHVNFPDPFTSGTNISYDLPESAEVHLAVYDLLGRRVVELVDGFREAGTHTMWLDASGMSGGVYLLRLKSGSYTRTERMVRVP
jgi:hypothetical protein